MLKTDPINWDGKFSGVFIPRFRNLDKKSKSDRFIRGYNMGLWPSVGMGPGAKRGEPGFGASFKQRIRDYQPAGVYLGMAGEMLPRYENFVEIDPDGVVDAWGVPVLKIHVSHSDNEREMAKDGAAVCAEVLEAAGATEIQSNARLIVPGRMIHELGTARMGRNPKTSVLNGFNQLHEVKNVFVTDGAAFTSSANQNPTLTILALTIRACDYLVDEYKRGNL
jgi:choline dehydrogenase-like flavoprotein